MFPLYFHQGSEKPLDQPGSQQRREVGEGEEEEDEEEGKKEEEKEEEVSLKNNLKINER